MSVKIKIAKNIVSSTIPVVGKILGDTVDSVIGGIVALIGFSKLIKHLEHMKRLLFNFLFFLTYVALLFIVDYIAVVTIVQAPRFAYTKSYIYKMDSHILPYYKYMI